MVPKLTVSLKKIKNKNNKKNNNNKGIGVLMCYLKPFQNTTAGFFSYSIIPVSEGIIHLHIYNISSTPFCFFNFSLQMYVLLISNSSGKTKDL